MQYSVIIPHYSDVERLGRLLRTIPLQLRHDIEVIVVDDCSPDQSSFEAMRVAWPQVRWLSTPTNAGAGAARNVGLDAARGHWLLFADSDDEFLSGAFDKLDVTLRAGDDLVYFLAEAVREQDGGLSVRSERMNKLVSTYNSAPSEKGLQQLQLQHVVPWAKAYARSFIEELQLRFDPVRVSNDIAFNVLAAVQAREVRAESERVYRVYNRAGSLTKDISPEGLLARLEVVCKLNDRLRALGLRQRMHAASYIARALQFGPGVLGKVILLMLRHEMLWITLKQLNPGRVWQFVLWFRKARKEFGLQDFPEDARVKTNKVSSSELEQD